MSPGWTAPFEITHIVLFFISFVIGSLGGLVFQHLVPICHRIACYSFLFCSGVVGRVMNGVESGKAAKIGKLPASSQSFFSFVRGASGLGRAMASYLHIYVVGCLVW